MIFTLQYLIKLSSQIVVLYVTDGLSNVGGELTEATVARYSQLAGSLGDSLSKAYCGQVCEDETFLSRENATNYTQDVKKLVTDLKGEKLFNIIPGRAFKSYPGFHTLSGTKHPERLRKKILFLSQRLDRNRKVATQNVG